VKPARRGQYPGVSRRMEPGRWHRRAEPRKERERIEVDRIRSDGERLLQCDAYEPIGTRCEPLLCDRRSKNVLEQGLSSALIHRTRARCRVEREAGAPDRKLAREVRPATKRRQRASAPGWARRRCEAADGRLRERGELSVSSTNGETTLTLSSTKPTPTVTKYVVTFVPRDPVAEYSYTKLVLEAEGEPARAFKQVDSWCTSNADCASSLNNGWQLMAPLPAACASAPATCVTCDVGWAQCNVQPPN